MSEETWGHTSRKAKIKMLAAFERVKGIANACPLLPEDRQKIMELGQDAQRRSLMGLGTVVNIGVSKVLSSDSMMSPPSDGFQLGRHTSLVLMKNGEVVGKKFATNRLPPGLRLNKMYGL